MMMHCWLIIVNWDKCRVSSKEWSGWEWVSWKWKWKKVSRCSGWICWMTEWTCLMCARECWATATSSQWSCSCPRRPVVSRGYSTNRHSVQRDSTVVTSTRMAAKLPLSSTTLSPLTMPVPFSLSLSEARIYLLWFLKRPGPNYMAVMKGLNQD